MSEANKLQIPFKIKRASKIIHVSLFAAVIHVLVIEMFTAENTFVGASLPIFFVGMFTLLVMVMLAFQIGLGKNWARMAFAVLFALNVFSLYPAVQANFELSPFVGALTILINVMQLLAILMLFSRDNSHYYRLKREQLMNEE